LEGRWSLRSSICLSNPETLTFAIEVRFDAALDQDSSSEMPKPFSLKFQVEQGWDGEGTNPH